MPRSARIAAAPHGANFSASVFMTAPIRLIRRLDLETVYHNWTVYQEARGTRLTRPGFRHVRPPAQGPAAGAAAARIPHRRRPRAVRLERPAEPIGPEPSRDAPEKRAAWQAAFGTLGPVGGADVRGEPDGRLLPMRST
jgi:hypothetical protein